MAQIRTELLVAYRSKGYAEVQQQTTKLAESASKANDRQAKGYSDVDKEVARLRGRLKDLASEQADLNKQLEAIADKASPAYKKLAENLKQVQTESSQVERVIRSLDKAFKEQTKSMEQMQRKGAFLQGFIQGAVPGAQFLQRGPGMRTQALGMGVGRAARGMGGALAGVPFGGAQAIAGALREIPFVGGLLAAPFQQAAGWGEMALGVQRQRVGMIPMLGGAGGAVGRARAAAGSRKAIAARGEEAFLNVALGELPEETMQSYIDFERERFMEEERKRWGEPGSDLAATAQRNVMESKFQQKAGETRLQDQAEVWARQYEGNKAREKATSKAATRAAQAGAGRRAARELFSPVRRAGARYLGVAEPEALQRVQGMVGAAGGSIADLRRQGILRAGMAAETMYGVQAPTAGLFARMGRLGARGGAIPGAEGAGAKALTDAIAGAMEMGLSGAEIPTYLQQIAAGITQWEQTGIPIADQAMTEFGRTIADYGFQGPRAAAMAGGFVRAAQGLSQRGPQTAGELLMMQTMGGFQGGGAGAFERAQIRMEQLRPEEVGGEQIQQLVGRLLQAGGGGAAGRMLARQQLAQMGIQVGAEEMQLLGTQMTGGRLTEAQQARLTALGEQRRTAAAGAPASPEEMQARAAQYMSDFGGALKKQAAIQNQQIETGTRMIPMLQNLEKTSGNLSNKFAELAGEPLAKLTSALEDLSEVIQKKDKGLIDTIAGWMT